MRKLLLLFLVSIFLITGCKTIPKDALILSPENLAQRQMQSRKYETKDEAKILAACSGLLQDLGFNLDESETKLGLIAASKTRSAVEAEQVVGAIILDILGALAGSSTSSSAFNTIDKEQKMRASVVTKPVGEHEEYIAVRVTFQRIVRNAQGQVTRSEGLSDPKMYQEFFDKLSKAIFLEAHEI